MSFPLLPDDATSTPDEDLEAAVAGALAIPTSPAPVAPQGPQPFGCSWRFDFEQGQFVRLGGAPAVTRELDTVEQWCQMVIHSARFAHAAFSDEFGMEQPDSPLGEIPSGELLADWQRHLVEALLVHDRISGVENIDVHWDPSQGILFVNSVDVITDEDQTLTLGGVAVQLGDTA